MRDLLRWIRGRRSEWLDEEIVAVLEAMEVDTSAPPMRLVWAIEIVRRAQDETVEYRDVIGGDLCIGWWIDRLRRELDIYTHPIKSRDPRCEGVPRVRRPGGGWEPLNENIEI